jgi:hypothetical protein
MAVVLEGMARVGAFKAAAVVGRRGGVASWCGRDVSGGGSGARWRAAKERGPAWSGSQALGQRSGAGPKEEERKREKKEGKKERKKRKKEKRKENREKENRKREKNRKKEGKSGLEN